MVFLSTGQTASPASRATGFPRLSAKFDRFKISSPCFHFGDCFVKNALRLFIPTARKPEFSADGLHGSPESPISSILLTDLGLTIFSAPSCATFIYGLKKLPAESVQSW